MAVLTKRDNFNKLVKSEVCYISVIPEQFIFHLLYLFIRNVAIFDRKSIPFLKQKFPHLHTYKLMVKIISRFHKIALYIFYEIRRILHSHKSQVSYFLRFQIENLQPPLPRFSILWQGPFDCFAGRLIIGHEATF